MTTSHFKDAPRFARSERTKALQALTAQRGYGDLRHFDISVEYSDGWGARRATLHCEAFPYEREDELRQLTMWIAQVVAHHRLSVPYASEADRSTLAHIAERAPDLEVSVRQGSEYVTRYQRVELPAHRPISVAV